MRDQAVPYLRCAHCGAGLTRRGRSLTCPAGHAFDIARQGYVNLLPRPTRYRADTAAMVAARVTFLAAGHYAPLADALASLAARTVGDDHPPPGCVVDVGGGTGYYQARVMDALPDREGVLCDLSPYAARRAARAHPRVSATVADAWQGLPVRDGGAALVLNVFAPRDAAELRRLLHHRGVLVVVTPRPDHLRELREAVGLLGIDAAKEDRLAEQLAPYFSVAESERLTHTMTLDHGAVAALVGMGPTAHHRSAAQIAEAVDVLPHRTEVTLAVTLTAYRPTADHHSAD